MISKSVKNTTSVLTEYTSETAEEFINSIQPESFTGKKASSSRIFRGQGDANWELIPAALRDWPKGQLPEEHIVSELKNLHKFFDTAWSTGLHFPKEVLQQIANIKFWANRGLTYFVDLLRHDPWFWPDKNLLRMFVIAHQYDIATRLLEFTKNPLSAAYYAAIQASELVKHADCEGLGAIAVWAIHADSVECNARTTDGYNAYIEIIHEQASTDNPIKDQETLFALLRYRCDASAVMESSACLESNPYGTILFSGNGRAAIFEKLTLPHSEVGNLLRLLHEKHGISDERNSWRMQGRAIPVKQID